MIKVYWLDCSPLFDEQNLARDLPYLCAERRTKTLRLQTAERRAQSAGAGLLLRRLFGDAEYEYGENGKPYLKGGNLPYFSLAHSDHFVVCAVDNSPIGIDIEPLSPIRPAVLRRCFSEKEQAWIGDNSERFTRLWTMKEAYMKMTGTGLSVPAKEINLFIPVASGYDKQNDCHWFFPEFCFPVSVCANSPVHPEMIEETIKDLL